MSRSCKGLDWETHEKVAEELAALNAKAFDLGRTINAAYSTKSRPSACLDSLVKRISALRFAMEEAALLQGFASAPEKRDVVGTYWPKDSK